VDPWFAFRLTFKRFPSFSWYSNPPSSPPSTFYAGEDRFCSHCREFIPFRIGYWSAGRRSLLILCRDCWDCLSLKQLVWCLCCPPYPCFSQGKYRTWTFRRSVFWTSFDLRSLLGLSCFRLNNWRLRLPCGVLPPVFPFLCRYRSASPLPVNSST